MNRRSMLGVIALSLAALTWSVAAQDSSSDDSVPPEAAAEQADAEVDATTEADDEQTAPPSGVPRASRERIGGGPDSVETQLQNDREKKPSLTGIDLLAPWEALQEEIADGTGLTIGGDYTATYFTATDSLGATTAASGIFRLYGRWNVIGRDTPDTGGLIYKVEHRHEYGKTAPAALASELGYVGLIEPPFSDEQWRLTNLYWRQSLFDNRFVTFVGFLDATDFVDTYALASPWTGFGNFVFSTGSATIGLPNDATLGAMAGFWITESFYVIGSITDANADPTDPFGGFETFFGDFETFKSIEFGWTTSKERFFLDNVHVTFWQIDARSDIGTSSGWGVNASASAWIDEMWLPFVRGGWADDGGSLLEASISAGVGFQAERGGSVLGIGVNWGRPNRRTFGARLDDQYTAEIFYRWQVTQNVQVTPSVQVLVDPALNPEEDVIGVFGVRARVAF